MADSEAAQQDQRFSRRSMLRNAAATCVGSMMVTDSSAEGSQTEDARRPEAGGGLSASAPVAQVMAPLEGIADLAAILRAVSVARTQRHDDIGRTFAGEIKLAPGRYSIRGPLDLATANGVAGLIISGSGVATEIIFEDAAATIRCASSRGVTFRDLTLRSEGGVDARQVAFTLDDRGNPLRSWRFERCDFIGFDQCFSVSGSLLDSEFYFDKCQFRQCFNLMRNSNPQAVNWNFVNCNWENSELNTSRETDLAAAFNLTKGSFIKWTGGSMIVRGRLVLYELKEAGSVQRPSHLIAFDGVRIELDSGKGKPVPFVDRIDKGYVSGTNQPTTTFTNCTIMQRGSGANPVYARAWSNCSLSFIGCKAKNGRVVGVLDHVSPTQAASIRLENTYGISYEEDYSQRLNSHDQHNVRIIPDGCSVSSELIVDQRACSLSVPAVASPKYMYIRGPTGSLPLGGTVVGLTALPDHTMLLRLFVRRFEPGRHRLTADLCDEYDQVTYASVTLEAGRDRFAEGDIGAEIGFQIPSKTPLILKFVGVPDVVKGIVGIEYL